MCLSSLSVLGPLQLQKILYVPDGFLAYFTAPERFPNLVTTLYNLVAINFSGDTILGRYVRLLIPEGEPKAAQLLSNDVNAEKPVFAWGTRSPHTVWFPDETTWAELTSASSVAI